MHMRVFLCVFTKGRRGQEEEVELVRCVEEHKTLIITLKQILAQVTLYLTPMIESDMLSRSSAAVWQSGGREFEFRDYLLVIFQFPRPSCRVINSW